MKVLAEYNMQQAKQSFKILFNNLELKKIINSIKQGSETTWREERKQVNKRKKK